MKKNYLKKRLTSLFVMLFLGYSAQAQTYVNLNATGANNGSSWADAFTNLQAGIDATAAGQSVFVAKGVYTAPAFGSFDIKEGVKIYGSFQGTETTLGDRIFGTNAGDTSVLKGDDMIVYSLNLTNASILDGFKITDGQTGIFNDNSNPSLSNLTITLIDGNGIFNMDSNPTISNSIISANEVSGIFNFNSSPTLTNVLISGNEENGIENIDNSALILKNVTITGNLLAGIANDDNSTVVAHNSIILGNTSGIINDGSSTATTQYSLVQGSSDILNGNLDATGILTSTIFVDPIAPGNSAAGDYAAKPCAITVDAGSNTLVPVAVTTDLAGNARIFNTTVDMGAYELDFIPVAITSTVDTTDCGTLVYNGLTYAVTGTHTLVLMAANGCDSTVTLNVTVNQPTTSTTNHTECAGGTYTWNGTPYTTDGTYTFLTTNAVGCDSTATLNLLFGAPSTSTTTKTTCNSFKWNGIIRTTSGTYTYTTTNAAGCDSTATLILTIGTLTVTVNQVSTTQLKAVSSGTNLTYRWVDCNLDAYIAGDTNVTFNVPGNGKYAVEVSDGVCKTMSSCVTMTLAGVNENDALNIGVQVYPNPTNGVVTILMTGASQADVRVFDGSGKLIKTYLNFNSEDTISLEEFSTGVYTLQIQTESGIKMERLIKN